MDVAELRQLASQATPGPWRVYPDTAPRINEDVGSPSDAHKPICRGHDYDDYGEISATDRAYIAAASPDRVIALLDENARLGELLKEAVRLLEGGRKGYVGDHYIREIQVKQTTVDRLRVGLGSGRL